MAKRAFANMLESRVPRSVNGVPMVDVREAGPSSLRIYMVPVKQVRENPYQTRIEYQGDHILNLVESLRANRSQLPATLGLQQPPTGRLGVLRSPSAGSAGSPTGSPTDGSYTAVGKVWHPLPGEILQRPEQVEAAIANGAIVQLAFGNNRWLAFRLLAEGPEALGIELPGFQRDEEYRYFPVALAVLTDRQMSDQAATENARRAGISALEEALSLRRRIQEFGMTHAQAGAPFGLSRVQVANKLALLELPGEVRQAIQRGELSESHGRILKQLLAAPHYVERVMKELLEADGVSTRDLQARVNGLIMSSRLESKIEWPLDWEPESGSEAVLGACVGCSYLVQFEKEEERRCTGDGCPFEKESLWYEEGPRVQCGKLRGALSKELAARVVAPGEDGFGIWRFGMMSAPAALIEEGYCSVETCACLRIVHSRYYAAEGVAPMRDVAPNYIYGCVDEAALAVKRALLGNDSEARSEATRKRAEERAAQEKIERANEEMAKEKVAAGLAAGGGVRQVIEARGFWAGLLPKERVKESMSVEELMEAVIWWQLELACKRYRAFENASSYAGYQAWDEKLLERELAARGLAVRRAPEKAGVAALTAAVGPESWQLGWDDADEEEWGFLVAMGEQVVAECADRPRVVLRMIGELEGKELRAPWWRRFQEIGGVEL